MSLAQESGVPGFAMPGLTLWAKGYHGGTHKWFRAEVRRLRVQFPRIHVRYLEDERGNSHQLALPELEAYLHAGEVMERDW